MPAQAPDIGPACEARTPGLGKALRACRAGFVGIAIASAMVNVLTLAGSIYMLQVYDRVIPSHSAATLVGLTVVLVLLYTAYGFFDAIRAQLLKRVGARFERLIRERVFSLYLTMPLRTARGQDSANPLRDMDQIRGFLSGPGPLAIFDLPWMPFFIGIVFLLHPLLGVLAMGGALVVVALTLMAEHRGRRSTLETTKAAARRHAFAEASLRNAEAVRALGMHGRVRQRWLGLSRDLFDVQLRESRLAGALATIAKVFRLFLQSAVLGLGAWLVIKGEASSGVIIAASITTSRALAPVEIAIAHWKGFLQARQSYARLETLLAAHPAEAPALRLPRPKDGLAVEQLFVGAPGEQRALIQNIGLQLEAGDGLGIIGPSASGKSTLVRAMVGLWRPLRGSVRLDGFTLDQWDPDDLGSAIGYLPQDVELFDGTIAENIARFEADADPDVIIEAATTAGVHEMIARLPQGYGTRIGEGGSALSAGQRQRIGLARALYGEPFLVVLDEPNSNLDSEGEDALTRAIQAVRKRGGIVVVVAHRPSALNALDKLLVMANGQQMAFGPREEVLRQTMRPAHGPLPAPAAAVPAGPRFAGTPGWIGAGNPFSAAPLARTEAARSPERG
ncbi:MAG: type I secretion system permease/ATPase [Alsobacter sp.]